MITTLFCLSSFFIHQTALAHQVSRDVISAVFIHLDDSPETVLMVLKGIKHIFSLTCRRRTLDATCEHIFNSSAVHTCCVYISQGGRQDLIFTRVSRTKLFGDILFGLWGPNIPLSSIHLHLQWVHTLMCSGDVLGSVCLPSFLLWEITSVTEMSLHGGETSGRCSLIPQTETSANTAGDAGGRQGRRGPDKVYLSASDSSEPFMIYNLASGIQAEEQLWIHDKIMWRLKHGGWAVIVSSQDSDWISVSGPPCAQTLHRHAWVLTSPRVWLMVCLMGKPAEVTI